MDVNHLVHTKWNRLYLYDDDSDHSDNPISVLATAMASPRAATAAEEQQHNLIEILEPSAGPIDIAKYVDFVRDSAAGAIATFEGTTRDTFDGKRVVELRYEAYVPMAARRLASILAEARAAWSLRRTAVAHRLGTVGVGEASVFVAVSSVHRAEAMEACRYVIDEVKASVPIWKKEVYENGEVWKENKEFLDRRPAAGGGGGGPGIVAHDKAHSCCGNKIRIQEGEEVNGDGVGDSANGGERPPSDE